MAGVLCRVADLYAAMKTLHAFDETEINEVDSEERGREGSSKQRPPCTKLLSQPEWAVACLQQKCYLRRRVGDEARSGDVTDERDDVHDDVLGAQADAPRGSRDASSRIHSATASETFSQPGWVTDRQPNAQKVR